MSSDLDKQALEKGIKLLRRRCGTSAKVRLARAVASRQSRKESPKHLAMDAHQERARRLSGFPALAQEKAGRAKLRALDDVPQRCGLNARCE
jgi:hypothetical protein